MNKKILETVKQIISKYQGKYSDIVERQNENGEDIDIDDEMRKYFDSLNIPYRVEFWRVYENPGTECHCLAVSWFANDEIELYTAELWVY